MKDAYLSFERPVLYVASRLIAWMYRLTNISPVRLVVAWEIGVGIIDTLLYAAATPFMTKLVGQMMLYYMVFVVLGKIAFECWQFVQLKRIPANYDAKAFKEASARAEYLRQDRALLRVVALSMIFMAFVVFSATYGSDLAWLGIIAGIYCVPFALFTLSALASLRFLMKATISPFLAVLAREYAILPVQHFG